MTFNQIRKLLIKTLKELETEVILESPDITDEELKQVLKIGKERILEEMGISQEYAEYEESLKEIGKAKSQKKKEELKQAITEAEERITSNIPPTPQTLTPEAIKALVSDSIKGLPKPTTTIINKIIKETTKEKPINTTKVIKETIKEIDKTELDKLQKDLIFLQEKFGEIKIPEVPDYEKLKSDLEKYSADHISGLWETMPDFRMLGMGLQGQIDALKARDVLDLSTYVPYTGATANVDLGIYSITAKSAILDDGLNNILIGIDAGKSITIATDNIALGLKTLEDNIAGSVNYALGNYAMQHFNQVVGNYFNVAIGVSAYAGAVAGATGNRNTVIGSHAMLAATTASGNTAIGMSAGYDITTGYDNVLLGLSAAENITTGYRNVIVGREAGPTLQTGNNNILIGYLVDVPLSNTSNFLNIGNIIYGNLSTTILRFPYYTTNGFVKFSGNDGTLDVDTATYLPLAGGTLTGNITLGEGVDPATIGIVIDPSLSADERYSGITTPGTAGATLAFGDLCYLDVTAGEWLLADADAASTSGNVPLGICVDASTDGNATSMLLIGTIRSAAFPASIALGAPVYVSTTAGDIQAAQPTGVDDVIRRVGWAITVEPNTIYFNPSNDYITHT